MMRSQSASESTENTISIVPPLLTNVGPRFYFLVIRSETSAILPLPEEGQLLVGRASDTDLRVPDQSASRHHARIVIVRGVVTVRDLGSRNRTWVNGEAIPEGQERILASGDVTAIGGSRIRSPVATKLALITVWLKPTTPPTPD